MPLGVKPCLASRYTQPFVTCSSRGRLHKARAPSTYAHVDDIVLYGPRTDLGRLADDPRRPQFRPIGTHWGRYQPDKRKYSPASRPWIQVWQRPPDHQTFENQGLDVLGVEEDTPSIPAGHPSVVGIRLITAAGTPAEWIEP